MLLSARTNMIKMLITVEGSGRNYPATITEEFCSICLENGKYPFHFTPRQKRKLAKILE